MKYILLLSTAATLVAAQNTAQNTAQPEALDLYNSILGDSVESDKPTRHHLHDTTASGVHSTASHRASSVHKTHESRDAAMHKHKNMLELQNGELITTEKGGSVALVDGKLVLEDVRNVESEPLLLQTKAGKPIMLSKSKTSLEVKPDSKVYINPKNKELTLLEKKKHVKLPEDAVLITEDPDNSKKYVPVVLSESKERAIISEGAIKPEKTHRTEAVDKSDRSPKSETEKTRKVETEKTTKADKDDAEKTHKTVVKKNTTEVEKTPKADREKVSKTETAEKKYKTDKVDERNEPETTDRKYRTDRDRLDDKDRIETADKKHRTDRVDRTETVDKDKKYRTDRVDERDKPETAENKYHSDRVDEMDKSETAEKNKTNKVEDKHEKTHHIRSANTPVVVNKTDDHHTSEKTHTTAHTEHKRDKEGRTDFKDHKNILMLPDGEQITTEKGGIIVLTNDKVHLESANLPESSDPVMLQTKDGSPILLSKDKSSLTLKPDSTVFYNVKDKKLVIKDKNNKAVSLPKEAVMITEDPEDKSKFVPVVFSTTKTRAVISNGALVTPKEVPKAPSGAIEKFEKATLLKKNVVHKDGGYVLQNSKVAPKHENTGDTLASTTDDNKRRLYGYAAVQSSNEAVHIPDPCELCQRLRGSNSNVNSTPQVLADSYWIDNNAVMRSGGTESSSGYFLGSNASQQQNPNQFQTQSQYQPQAQQSQSRNQLPASQAQQSQASNRGLQNQVLPQAGRQNLQTDAASTLPETSDKRDVNMNSANSRSNMVETTTDSRKKVEDLEKRAAEKEKLAEQQKIKAEKLSEKMTDEQKDNEDLRIEAELQEKEAKDDLAALNREADEWVKKHPKYAELAREMRRVREAKERHFAMEEEVDRLENERMAAANDAPTSRDAERRRQNAVKSKELAEKEKAAAWQSVLHTTKQLKDAEVKANKDGLLEGEDFEDFREYMRDLDKAEVERREAEAKTKEANAKWKEYSDTDTSVQTSGRDYKDAVLSEAKFRKEAADLRKEARRMEKRKPSEV